MASNDFTISIQGSNLEAAPVTASERIEKGEPCVRTAAGRLSQAADDPSTLAGIMAETTQDLDGLFTSGDKAEGPLIVEEYDSTTVVPPGWNATADRWSNIILQKA